MRQSELEHIKIWRVRAELCHLRKGYKYCLHEEVGLKKLMLEHYEREIPRFEAELKRRREFKK